MKVGGFFRGEGQVPSSEELHAALAHVGHQHVRLDLSARTVRFDVPGVELDLGGIAKGYAVDCAVCILRENGITAALISSGMSSIYALGAPPNEEGWTIALRDPFDSTIAANVIRLKNFSCRRRATTTSFSKSAGRPIPTSWILVRACRLQTCSLRRFSWLPQPIAMRSQSYTCLGSKAARRTLPCTQTSKRSFTSL
jgi:ApbE family protein